MLNRVLRWLTDATLTDAIVGDLHEQRRVRAERSRVRAGIWYARVAAAVVVSIALARLTRPADAGGEKWSARGGAGVGREALQALRSIRRSPSASLVIVATLALGIGITTAIFSVVHAVLFQPLPFANADRVVFVQGRQGDGPPNLFGTSLLDYRDLRAANQSFAEMATTAYWTFTVTGTDVPLRLVGNRVSGTFFPMLGARPVLGRTIAPADDAPGGDEVMVLSYGLWQRMFGGEASVIGRTVALNGVTARVIGVMPRGFAFPAEDVELWVPMRDELNTVPRGSRFFATVGRLGSGITPAQATSDLASVTAGLAREFPADYRDWQPVAAPVLPVLTRDARPRLLLLLAAVVVVLLVAGVNITALLAARASARFREAALRRALGAGDWRLARLALVESAWLVTAGFALGLVLAAPTSAALRALAPGDVPRLSGATLSWPVLAWTAAVMLVFMGVGALVPLLRWRDSPAGALRTATTAGAPAGWPRRLLVAGQVAAAFVLLVAAGLLVRSFVRVLDVDPGFEPRNLAIMRVFLTPPSYRTIDQQTRYVEEALVRLSQAPGVAAAAAVTQPPFDDRSAGTRLFVALEGRSFERGTNPGVFYRGASASYFHTAGLRVVDGDRLPIDAGPTSPRVLVVNRSAADRLWPGERAVGRRLRFVDTRDASASASFTPTDWHTVIGVVEDIATDGLETREPPAVYAPFQQRTLVYLRWMTFVVRAERDASVALPGVRAALQSVDPNQPIYAVSTMDEVIGRSVAERRFTVVLMLAFATLTLVLAMLGVYGALAQTVTSRAHEIGVRLALGAQPARVFRRVVRDGFAIVVAGCLAGATVAWAGASRLESLLFGVPPTDAVTYGAIALGLALVGAVACALPAHRASRIDPMQALRD